MAILYTKTWLFCTNKITLVVQVQYQIWLFCTQKSYKSCAMDMHSFCKISVYMTFCNPGLIFGICSGRRGSFVIKTMKIILKIGVSKNYYNNMTSFTLNSCLKVNIRTTRLMPNSFPCFRPSTGIPVLHSGSHFRHGLLQLMIHTIDPLHDGRPYAFTC